MLVRCCYQLQATDPYAGVTSRYTSSQSRDPSQIIDRRRTDRGRSIFRVPSINSAIPCLPACLPACFIPCALCPFIRDPSMKGRLDSQSWNRRRHCCSPTCPPPVAIPAAAAVLASLGLPQPSALSPTSSMSFFGPDLARFRFRECHGLGSSPSYFHHVDPGTRIDRDRTSWPSERRHRFFRPSQPSASGFSVLASPRGIFKRRIANSDPREKGRSSTIANGLDDMMNVRTITEYDLDLKLIINLFVRQHTLAGLRGSSSQLAHVYT